MHPQRIDRRERGTITRLGSAALITLGIWAAGRLGALAELDGWLYDRIAEIDRVTSDAAPHVVLVELSEGQTFDSTLCTELSTSLLDLGARRVLFTSLPHPLDPRDLEILAETPAIAFGRKLVGDPYEPDVFVPEPAPDGLRTGIVSVPAGVRGVHRKQRAVYEFDGTVLHALEVIALDDAPARGLDAAGELIVRFAGPPGTLPRIQVDRIQQKRLVPELVLGKTILVGDALEASERFGLDTPTTGPTRMSQLEFHGNALNTLLTGTASRPLSPGLALSLVLCAAALHLIICQWTHTTAATWIAAIGVSASLFLGYTGLRFLRVWPPITELALSQFALFLVVARAKARQTDSWARGIVVGASARLSEKLASHSVDSRAECWLLASNMVNQCLDLNRSVFLEVDRDSELLREARALGCSFDDIVEKRRQYLRAPYVTAIETNTAVRVDGFLKRSFDREDQYIVPLLAGGDVLGIWVCGVDPTRLGKTDIVQLLREYAHLLSSFLVHHLVEEGARSLGARLTDLLIHGHNSSVLHRLEDLLRALERRLEQKETLLSDIHTATAVYDLFGRLEHVNEQMIHILELERLSPHQMTALDLICTLSEYDTARSRRILRHVFVDRQAITFPVSLATRPDSRFMLHLHPLHSATSSGESRDDISTRSIVCELVDTTAFTEIFEMKEKLANRLGLQLRNDLASIDLSSSLLAKDNLDPSQRSRIASIIHDKVSRTMDVLIECQQYLTLEHQAERVERFPVDSLHAFTAARKEVGPSFSLRDLRVEVIKPKLMSFVLASTDNLRIVFETIFRLIAADAVDDSAIVVEIVESEDMVAYEFRNTGFGIPNDRFQEYIFGDLTLANEELKRFREGVSWVEAWGGDLEANSEVGHGTRATLRLVKFI